MDVGGYPNQDTIIYRADRLCVFVLVIQSRKNILATLGKEKNKWIFKSTRKKKEKINKKENAIAPLS